MRWWVWLLAAVVGFLVLRVFMRPPTASSSPFLTSRAIVGGQGGTTLQRDYLGNPP